MSLQGEVNRLVESERFGDAILEVVDAIGELKNEIKDMFYDLERKIEELKQ